MAKKQDPVVDEDVTDEHQIDIPPKAPELVNQKITSSPKLSVSFSQENDGAQYHAIQAKNHLEALGFKAALTAASLMVWTEELAQ